MPNMRKAYEKTSCKINKLMQKFHFGMVKLTLNFGFWSIAVLCTFNYFYTNFDEGELILPVLMW